MKSDYNTMKFESLRNSLEGDLKYDLVTRTMYATDASVYKEMPLVVTWPKSVSDIKKILAFASLNKLGITMRAGVTSLAGQVVGSGIIVDISRHMNKIKELNEKEMWVKVEPGVVLDELNLFLRDKGLFFGPETSTASRCNLAGMVGNNACGSHSLIYGSTRDHTLELKTILSDGSEVTFGPLNKNTFEEKCRLPGLEGSLYSQIKDILGDSANRDIISKGFPDKKIPRRNTGYARDLLMDNEVFAGKSGVPFNFCKMLAGSEGTLAIITEIKLNLVRLPSPHKALVCIHLRKRNDAFLVNLIALRHKPSAVEMMDDRILKLTENNLSQRNNRFFLKGNPGSIVIVEFVREHPDKLDQSISELIHDLKASGYGYAYPTVKGTDISKVWALRKAGLGVLTNMNGDSKPVSLIEDTAVNVEQLPDYIADFEEMLSRYGKEVVYHAHIGTGELHIRPVLNLKDPADAELFRTIGMETARLVKKYRGSMSGEHGDGRLRGEFIPVILGEKNYSFLKEIKKTWDPDNLLNPGKITDTPRMNTSLRYIPGMKTPEPEIFMIFRH
jgi:FAD/FMN-containing dehydrogenase